MEESALAGVNFLSSGLAFGGRGLSSLYVFGGMCPDTDDDDGDGDVGTWTREAQYSDQMLTFSPHVNGRGDYSMDMVASRGPPIAEAGFSITPLTPTFAFEEGNHDDEGEVEARSRQQSFVLLGGHTQSAFINMSQVALFSLPQESWSFLPVEQPSSSAAMARRDLDARQDHAGFVEPRSGHTAVLTEDGSKVVLFGGWVGDVETPAQPQLAVLNVGSGFGGDSNDWSWSIPAQDGEGLETGSGIYGHGAAMLPGDVMMVTGGYSIDATNAKLLKRDVADQVMLFNVSSNSWISTYDPPKAYLKAMSEKESNDGPLSSASQKTGLAVGLVIGVLLLLGLVFFYFWYSKRLKRRRQDREQEVASSHERSMSQIGEPFLQSHTGYAHDRPGLGRFWSAPQQSANAYPWDPSGTQTYHNREREADSTGLLLNIPSPTRGLRKGVAGRPYAYHKAPRYDDKRTNTGSGNVHPIGPIAEREDEDDQSNRANNNTNDEDVSLSQAQWQLKEIESVFNPVANRQLRDVEKALQARPVRPISDPFRDPSPQPNPLGSHPVSPEVDARPASLRVVPTEDEFNPSRLTRADTNASANWVYPSDPVEYDEEAPSHSEGRTSSSLSEHSQRSIVSGNSITRTVSSGTVNLMAKLLNTSSNRHYSSPESSPVDDNRVYSFTSSNGGGKPLYHSASHKRGRSATAGSSALPPLNTSADADSFTAARYNFVDLQQEGTTLLGGAYHQSPQQTYPTTAIPSTSDRYDRDDPYQRALAAHSPRPARQPTIRYAGTATPSPSAIDYIPHQLPKRPRQGWMGSLRKAIGAMSERSFSLTSNSGVGATQAQNSNTTNTTTPSSSAEAEASSPTKRYHSSLAARARTQTSPRRALSDGGAAALLRSKRGKGDWDDDDAADFFEPYTDFEGGGDWGPLPIEGVLGEGKGKGKGKGKVLGRSVTHGGNWARQAPQYRDDDDTGVRAPVSSGEEEDDWDVETAARKRDVQVMFTIPKTRLRVVNADVEGGSLRSLSEGGGSLRRGGSVLSRGSVRSQQRRRGSGDNRRVAGSGREGEGVKEGRLVDVGSEGEEGKEGFKSGVGVEEGVEVGDSSEEEFPPRQRSGRRRMGSKRKAGAV